LTSKDEKKDYPLFEETKERSMLDFPARFPLLYLKRRIGYEKTISYLVIAAPIIALLQHALNERA
jgi:hypothetical protein